MPLVFVNIKLHCRYTLFFPNMPFSTCLHLVINKSFLVYAYIRVPKNAALYMTIIWFARMPLWIYLHLHLKRYTSVYVYVTVSIYVSKYVTILFLQGYVPPSKCMWFSQILPCIPLSWSLRMLIYICLYMRILKVRIFIWLYFILKETHLSMATTAYMKILSYIRQYYSSQKCPFLYSYICGSIMPLVYVKIEVYWRPILGFPNIIFSICLKMFVNKI